MTRSGPEAGGLRWHEFVDWLVALEGDYPVTEWTVGGIHVLPRLRFRLLAAHFERHLPAPSPPRRGAVALHKVASVARELAAWAVASVRDRANTGRGRRPATALVLKLSLGDQPLVGGKRYNPVFDPYIDLIEASGASWVAWERAAQGRYHYPRATPSTLVEPLLLCHQVAARLGPTRPPAHHLPGFEGFAARIAAAGLRWPYERPQPLIRDGAAIRRLAEAFKNRLRPIGPKISFYSSYDLVTEAFTLACRELGVMTVELQHGVIGAGHPAYASWPVPAGGYETRADVFWCWDEASAQVIDGWAHATDGAHRTIVGGDPWRGMLAEGRIAAEVAATVGALKAEFPADQHVLVTLTSFGDVVPDWMVEAMERSSDRTRYWVRLHPVNQLEQRRMAERAFRNVRSAVQLMQPATELPLFGLLAHMDGHLTGSLTTVIGQAADAGVRSISGSPDAAEAYPEAARMGWLDVAHSSRELLALLPKLRRGTGGRLPDHNGSRRAMLELLEEASR